MSVRVGEALAERAAVSRCEELLRVDWLVGGFPCQDLSSAGKRAGVDGSRSGLWREFVRLVDELRPRGVLIENVHHSWRQWVPVLRRALWELGYPSLPIRLRASDFGAWHQRSRVFLVAHVDASVLRLESWRRGWPFWEDPPLFADTDESRRGTAKSDLWPREPDAARSDAADADSTGRREVGTLGTWSAQSWRDAAWRDSADIDTLRELQPKGCEPDERRRFSDGGWWATEPDVVRVVYGIPSRVDGCRMAARIAALGNAVVPPEILWLAQQIQRAEKEALMCRAPITVDAGSLSTAHRE